MTDDVARELDQAEARLDALLRSLRLRGRAVDSAALDAAIEVGRLRLIAEMMTPPTLEDGSPLALAAREDVQGG